MVNKKTHNQGINKIYVKLNKVKFQLFLPLY